MRLPAIGLAMLLAPAFGSMAMGAERLEVYASSDPALALGELTAEGAATPRTLTLGIGSAAARRADDPPLTFWTVSDRGPNFTCGDVEDVLGIDGTAICGENKGRIYPLPTYSPTLYRITLKDDGSFALDESIPLADRDGTPSRACRTP